jgi:hypothetical protein
MHAATDVKKKATAGTKPFHSRKGQNKRKLSPDPHPVFPQQLQQLPPMPVGK